eukprot:jgi/Botrbrau1/20419/Bobra.0006s0073.1
MPAEACCCLLEIVCLIAAVFITVGCRWKGTSTYPNHNQQGFALISILSSYLNLCTLLLINLGPPLIRELMSEPSDVHPCLAHVPSYIGKALVYSINEYLKWKDLRKATWGVVASSRRNMQTVLG